MNYIPKNRIRGVVTLIFFLLAQYALAQLPNITVKVPNVKRFVQITADNVNLRRLPNATSGKVMSWSSDGGSIDTYEKLFYADTEKTRYRANNMTGAYISTFHPMKGELYMVSNKNPEPQNGWYQILVTASENSGNPGHANAKMAWVNASFCKVIDINEDQKAQENINIPISFKWDDIQEREIPEDVIPYTKGFRIGLPGTYKGVRLMFNPKYDENTVNINVLNHIGNFIYCSRLPLQIKFGAQSSTKATFKITEEEADMEDADPTQVLQVSLKESAPVKNTLLTIVTPLIDPHTEAYKMFYGLAWPNNNIPTDEVYFLGKDGKCYSFKYDQELLNEYGYYTHSIAIAQ